MAGILVLFTLLLLALHLTSAAQSMRIRKMREQLLCLISGEAESNRIRGKLYEMMKPDGEIDSISDIEGIRSIRGLQVISEIADELPGDLLTVLRREVGGEWFGKYLDRQLIGRNTDSIILVVKLIGSLKLEGYITDVVAQIYCHRTMTQMQHIGMLSLCLLGAEKSWLRSAAIKRSRRFCPSVPWRSCSAPLRAIARSSAEG
jgi:hypothetical protein